MVNSNILQAAPVLSPTQHANARHPSTPLQLPPGNPLADGCHPIGSFHGTPALSSARPPAIKQMPRPIEHDPDT
jgi:hypothetical protein